MARLLIPMLVMSCLVCACGGGGADPAAQDQELVVELQALVARSAIGTTRLDDPTRLRIGNIGGVPYRLLLRFSLADLPQDRPLERVQIYVDDFIIGFDASALLGDLIVQTLDMGASVDASDGDRAATTAGPPLEVDGLVGPKTSDVTTAVQQLIQAGATYVDFRLQFAADTTNPGRSVFAEVDDKRPPTCILTWGSSFNFD